jgi:cellulose synthase/poly-beta-1,6-N-acetylglucosamine synthase-like glycosyltransferase
VTEADGAIDDDIPVAETEEEAQPLGEFLVAVGAINKRQLAEALEDSAREGSLLGEQLVINGAIKRRRLYDALAHVWGHESRDLVRQPPDHFTAASVDYRTERTEHWLPCEYRGGSLVVATSERVTPEMEARVAHFFPGIPLIWQITTPWDLGNAIRHAHADDLVYEASNALADAAPHQSAREGLTLWQTIAPAAAVAALIGLVAIDPRLGIVWILTICDVVFTISILFKAAASVRQPLMVAARERRRLGVMRERAARGLPPVPDRRVPDDELPIYTVLVPVYHEANIVEKLIDHLSVLDYPKSKLEVMVLMEADDEETVAAARGARPPEFIRLIVVPPGEPQTKPRACNYGLALARGEYVVIFDAEDRPEPDQLRMAVARFERDRFEREVLGRRQKQLAVVQAALHYFNADYNVLTRMFAIEYAHWFTSMLPGLDGTGIPLPLGGTSNHFDTAILRKLGAWDPYNVTEDADLGLRASVMGYRVAVISSSTGEEACSQVPAWIRQRTRWIKGYLMTAAVNLRHPLQFLRSCGLPGIVGMIGLILGTPLSFLCYPLMMAFTLVTWVGVHSFGIHLEPWTVVMSTSTAVGGNLLMILVSGFAATRRYNWRIGLFAVFNPIYWFLHSFAAWRALLQSFFDPHHWEKTPHGLSEDYESTAHH